MNAPGDPFATPNPVEPAAEAGPERGEAGPDAGDRPFEPDLGLLDRAEETFAGASRVLSLVDSGDLDRAETELDTMLDVSPE